MNNMWYAGILITVLVSLTEQCCVTFSKAMNAESTIKYANCYYIQKV